jgi:hypothetical protein
LPAEHASDAPREEGCCSPSPGADAPFRNSCCGAPQPPPDIKKRSRAGLALNTNWIGIAAGVAVIRLLKPELVEASRAGMMELLLHVAVILVALCVAGRCAWYYLSVWRVHNALQERGFEHIALGDSAYILVLLRERGDGATAADDFPRRERLEERHPGADRSILSLGEALLRATPHPAPAPSESP